MAKRKRMAEQVTPIDGILTIGLVSRLRETATDAIKPDIILWQSR
jgi:hypothetical protein